MRDLIADVARNGPMRRHLTPLLVALAAACGGDSDPAGPDTRADVTADVTNDVTSTPDSSADVTSAPDATTDVTSTPDDTTPPEDDILELAPEDIAHPPSDACPGCYQLTPSLPVAHGGEAEGFQLVVDPSLDDAIARWGDCLGDVIGCLQSGDEFVTCLDGASRCDSGCIAQVKSARATPTWFDFRNVFLSEGAPCRPTAP